MAQRNDRGTAPTIAWDVTSATDPDAFDKYRDSLADMLEVVEIDPEVRRNFVTQTSATMFANGGIGFAGSVGHTLERTPRSIRASGIDAINITFNMGDMACDCDGRTFRATPGALQFRDLARPSASRLETLDLVTLMVPREAFSADLRDGLHGEVIEPWTAPGRMIAGYLRLLAHQAAAMRPEEGVVAIQAALLMIERAMGRRREATAPEARAIHEAVRTQASRYIRSRLLDPTLTVQDVATAVGASRTTLFRAFAPGGLRRHMIDLRLDRARAVLINRGGRRETVAEVAFRHGFASAAHFSRLYRERFGHAPGETAPSETSTAKAVSAGSPIRHDLVMVWLRDRAEIFSRSPAARYA